MGAYDGGRRRFEAFWDARSQINLLSDGLPQARDLRS